MTAPICPVHHVPMKDFGDNWKCTKKTGMGPKDFCKQRVVKQEAPAQAPAVTPAIPATPDQEKAQAALEFAGAVFQGSSQIMDALNAARLAFDFLENPRGGAQ